MTCPLRSYIRVVSAFEEPHQGGSEDFVSRAVVLTWKAAVLGIGEDVYERLSPVVKKRRTRSSDHDERGHGDRSPLPECRGIAAHSISHDGAVVGMVCATASICAHMGELRIWAIISAGTSIASVMKYSTASSRRPAAISSLRCGT